MKVFIIHTRRTGYGVIRALADSQAEIYGADTIKSEAAFSKYLKGFFILPEMSDCSEDHFMSVLISLAKQMCYEREKPIVFTGRDDYLIFCAKHYDRLSQYFDFTFETDYHTLVKALDKLELANVASQCGVLAPKSYRLEDFKERNISFPVIIKPAIKTRPEIDVVDKGFRLSLCRDINQLHAAANTMERLKQPYIIQELIQGDDASLFTFGAYCYKGKLIAWSTGRKIRQFPPGTGECSFGETCYAPSLIEPSESLIKTIGLTGILQIEYKQCDGKFYLIEINPRIWSWHEIHRLVGVNFAAIAIDNVLKRKTFDHLISPERTRKTWMFLSMDILHNALLNDNVSIAQIFSDYLQSDLEAFFNPDDLQPCSEHWAKTVFYILREIQKRKAKIPGLGS